MRRDGPAGSHDPGGKRRLRHNAQPGDRVLFLWRGAWVRGIIAGDGTDLRLPIIRDDGPGKRRIHWRNRTKIYELSYPAAPEFPGKSPDSGDGTRTENVAASQNAAETVGEKSGRLFPFRPMMCFQLSVALAICLAAALAGFFAPEILGVSLDCPAPVDIGDTLHLAGCRP